MELVDSQIHRANAIYLSVKNLWERNPEFIKKADIKQCDACSGTGLDKYVKIEGGGYQWDPGNYCDTCHGIGYIHLDDLCKISLDETTYICGECYGIGCGNCEDTGKVDWITHAMGR